MVWIEFKAFWFFLPPRDDVLIRGESMESLESLGKVISIQEVKQMLSDLCHEL
jgi:hypothetical protein